MKEFLVEAMSCSHCVNVVTSTVHALDPAAEVMVDLGSKHVRVESDVDAFIIAQALRDAGYDPEVLGDATFDEKF
jgi:copper chaperone